MITTSEKVCLKKVINNYFLFFFSLAGGGGGSYGDPPDVIIALSTIVSIGLPNIGGRSKKFFAPALLGNSSSSSAS